MWKTNIAFATRIGQGLTVAGLTVPPPPNSSPKGEEDGDYDQNMDRRRMTVTTRQIVNRMSMLEAFSDAVSRTFRPHTDTLNKAPPNPDAAFSTYIPFEFDFNIVPDPETTKLTWVQKAADTLYYLIPVALILTSILSSLTLYAVSFLPDVYAKKTLRMVLLESTYVNAFVFLGADFGLTFLMVMFLCYPHRSEWGRFHKMRWILVGIVNMIMVVGLLDQFYWVVNFSDLGHELRENMMEGLDVTRQTTLTRTSQIFFGCCGIDGYKDWESILMQNRSLYYGGFPTSCCSDDYEKSCSIPVTSKLVKGTDGVLYGQLWPIGCYADEIFMLHVTISIIWIVILLVAVTSICKTLFLWWVVRNINVHDLTIVHPFRP